MLIPALISAANQAATFGAGSPLPAGITLVGRKIVKTSDLGLGDQTISLTNLTGGSDAAPKANDIVIVGHFPCTTDGTTVHGINTAGYSYAVESSYDGGLGAWHQHRIGYKVMSGTPDTSVSVKNSSSGGYGAMSVIYVFRGVDTTSPIDVAGSAVNGSGDPPSKTPLTQGAILIAAASGRTSGTPSNWTTADLDNYLSDNVNPGPANVPAIMGYEVWSGSGAINIAAFGGGTGTVKVASAFVLKPAA